MQSSRRNFIKTAAVTAAAVVCAPATGIHASEKKSSPAMAPDASGECLWAGSGRWDPQTSRSRRATFRH